MAKKDIEIDGVNYRLDVDKALEQGVMIQRNIISKGCHFRDIAGGTYVLSGRQDDYTLRLVNIATGDHYRVSATRVEDVYDVSDEEWAELTGGRYKEFLKVGIKIEIVR